MTMLKAVKNRPTPDVVRRDATGGWMSGIPHTRSVDSTLAPQNGFIVRKVRPRGWTRLREESKESRSSDR